MINPKIGRAHLSRRAVVYLRQSTPHQVESNRESTSRQYALAERASELGWDKSLIQILDGDLGKSGQSTTGREDFHRLMAAVGFRAVPVVENSFQSHALLCSKSDSFSQKDLATRGKWHNYLGSDQPQSDFSHLTQPNLYGHLCLWQTAHSINH